VAAAAWAVAATGSITAETNLAKTFLCLNSERWKRGGCCVSGRLVTNVNKAADT
jgi:hypothetical protein